MKQPTRMRLDARTLIERWRDAAEYYQTQSRAYAQDKDSGAARDYYASSCAYFTAARELEQLFGWKDGQHT